MSISNHTPLPWSIRPKQFDDWGYIRGANGDIACCARGADDMQFDAHRTAGTDPYQANADLIVCSVNAVPGLVKALEEIGYIDDFLDADSAKRMLGIARDALATYRKDS